MAEKAEEKIPYSQDAAERVIARVGKGEAVRAICADPDMPSMLTLKAWRRKHKKFAGLWAEAMARKPSRESTGLNG